MVISLKFLTIYIRVINNMWNRILLSYLYLQMCIYIGSFLINWIINLYIYIYIKQKKTIIGTYILGLDPFALHQLDHPLQYSQSPNALFLSAIFGQMPIYHHHPLAKATHNWSTATTHWQRPQTSQKSCLALECWVSIYEIMCVNYVLWAVIKFSPI